MAGKRALELGQRLRDARDWTESYRGFIEDEHTRVMFQRHVRALERAAIAVGVERQKRRTARAYDEQAKRSKRP
jgi:hypothetical protein